MRTAQGGGAVSDGARGRAAFGAWKAAGGCAEETRGPSPADSVGTGSFAKLGAAVPGELQPLGERERAQTRPAVSSRLRRLLRPGCAP